MRLDEICSNMTDEEIDQFMVESEYKLTEFAMLTEKVQLNNETGDMLQAALDQFNAAKRGLSVANKLKDPAQKKKHQSRIMSNINVLRGLLRQIEKRLS